MLSGLALKLKSVSNITLLNQDFPLFVVLNGLNFFNFKSFECD